MTLPLPTSFPSQNTHRLVHLNPQPDYARLEEMTADAIAHLRAVADAVSSLPPVERKVLPKGLGDLVIHALSGDVLSPDMQIAGLEVSDAIEAQLASGRGSEALQQMSSDLREGMTLGRRVFDLLLAEHQIAKMRLGFAAEMLTEDDQG